MKPRQRQAAILEFLQSQGKCSVEELAQHFDTTGTTIRKDLVTLENATSSFAPTVAWYSTRMKPIRRLTIKR